MFVMRDFSPDITAQRPLVTKRSLWTTTTRGGSSVFWLIGLRAAPHTPCYFERIMQGPRYDPARAVREHVSFRTSCRLTNVYGSTTP
jgi:hypothetical protein